MKKRTCTLCNKSLPIDRFSKSYNNQAKKTYLRSWCKICDQERFKKYCSKNWQKRLISVAKARAKKEGKLFTLTEQSVNERFERQKGRCFYFNLPLSTDYMTKRDPFRVSLDRIQAGGNYTEDNVVLCSTFANFVRGDADLQSFTQAISLMTDCLIERREEAQNKTTS